jgi:hypothetical protein
MFSAKQVLSLPMRLYHLLDGWTKPRNKLAPFVKESSKQKYDKTQQLGIKNPQLFKNVFLFPRFCPQTDPIKLYCCVIYVFASQTFMTPPNLIYIDKC